MKNGYIFILCCLVLGCIQNCFSQSCANYAVSRTTGITYNSVSSTANVIPYWRNQEANQNDDNRSNPVPIGFDFWYLGARYTTVNVAINGFIDFSTTSYDGNWPLNASSPQPPGYSQCGSYVSYREDGNTFCNVPCGSGSPPSSYDGTYWALAPMYCDLWCSNGVNALANSIKYKTIGTAPNRVFIVEYLNMDDWASGSISDYNFQIRLYETTGVIEYDYGTINPAPGSPTPYACGINGRIQTNPPASSELLVQQADNSPVFSNVNPGLHYTAPTSNSKLTFTPPVPANTASTLTFTGVGNTTMTLNWTDWATNEQGYVIYMSTDGINYSFYTQTTANATSFTASNLFGTTYWWKVYAVTEGCLSSPATGSQATLAAGTFISITSGNWSNGATWNAGTVPTIGDNVIIANGHTVTIDGSYGCINLTVGQGTSGTLLIGNSTTARSLTILGNITVNNGASFNPNTLFAATHTMTVSGNVINNGSLNMKPNATSLCNLIFNKNGNQTISGTGGTNTYNNIALSMGGKVSNILEVTASNFAAPSNFLTMNNGTFKFSVPTSAVTLDVFTSATAIPVTCGLWMNSPNSTMYAHSTLYLQGDLTCSSGTVNIGDNADETLMSNGAFLTLTGGTINVAGRLDRPSYVAVTNISISGGTLNLNTIGSTSTSAAPFMIDVIGSTFNMTGGKIVIRKNGANNLGYYNINCSPYNFSGGILQIGDALTPAGQTMQLYTDNPIANFTINTNNNPTAQLASDLEVSKNTIINSGGTLNCNSFNLNMGGDVANNGSFIAGNNTTTFDGASAQQITGTTTPFSFNNLTINNSSGNVTINNSGSVNVNNTLNFTNGKIVLGTHNLVITSGNSITGFNANNYVVTNGNSLSGGSLQINNVTASRDFPIGPSTSSYAPVLNFVNAGTADNFNARVIPGVFLLGLTGLPVINNVVNNTWLINESTLGGSNVDMKLQWNAADEFASFTRTNCGISRYIPLTSLWDTPPLSGSAIASPAPNYYIARTGVSLFLPFIIKSGVSPLPIELLNFTAKLNKNNQTDIDWSTASETNNDYFTIERRENENTYPILNSIPGAGTSNTVNKYHCLDNNPVKGKSYYRIKQTDFDGHFTYSDFVEVNLNDDRSNGLSVSPNPFIDKLNVSYKSTYEGKLILEIYNNLSQKVYSRQLTVKNGENSFYLNNLGLIPGVFTVKIIDEKGEILSKSIVKNN